MQEKHINLALQGGGAHGAFAWGVIDRLLDEDWLHIDAISGTSAGALNGAALKAGLTKPGRIGRRNARANLDFVWSEVGSFSDNRILRWACGFSPVTASFQRVADMFTPSAFLEAWTRMFSPYDSGPFYTNPLRPILDGLPNGNFACADGPELHVTGTNVRTGRVRVFSNDHASTEAVMASACLPTMFRAVRVKDPLTGKEEDYWDGGFTGNPALFPLYRSHLPRDVVIVNINPLVREELPTAPIEIQDRINEVSFNSSLMAELRAINFVKRLFREDRLRPNEEKPMKNVLVHMILDDDLMNRLSARTKLLPGPGLLGELKLAGQAAANDFIENNADKLNKEDSIDLRALFGGA